MSSLASAFVRMELHGKITSGRRHSNSNPNYSIRFEPISLPYLEFDILRVFSTTLKCQTSDYSESVLKTLWKKRQTEDE